MTTTTLADLWHRSGRAARDDRKRLIALLGVFLTPPVWVLGSFLVRLLTSAPLDLGGMRRPLGYALAPLHDAWMEDADLLVLLYLFVQSLSTAALWGWFGGAISRMAAVHVATDRREPGAAAFRFSRRHWRAFAGAKAVLWAGVLVPAAGAVLAAMLARLPGIAGGLLSPVAIVVAAALALVSVVVASVFAAAGFLSTPTVASEDSDAFDAVSRVFGYAAAGMPRLVLVRAAFFGGVLLGTTWRALRTVGAVVLGAVLFRAGAGDAAVERVRGVLAAFQDGTARPAGTTFLDVVAAATVVVVVGGLFALWAADLVTRILCARVGAYLYLRERVDRVPASTLRTAPADPGRLDAEQAGFVEVARVGEAGPRRGSAG
jgi:hypothetical protein